MSPYLARASSMFRGGALLLALASFSASSIVACIDFSPMTGGSKSPSSSSSSSTASSKTSLDPTAPDCPDAPKCLSDRECTYDSARACQVCVCGSPFGADPNVGGVPPVK